MSAARLGHLTAARVVAVCAVLGGLLVLSLLLSVSLGPEGVDLLAVLDGERGSVAADIILQVRLPRLCLAAIAGAALAATGVAFQALLRNPLADPYILGVSAGAALGGSIAVAFGLGATVLGAATLPVWAFAGAIGTVFILYGLARVSNRVSTHTLLLTGVVFNAFSGAAIMYIKTVISSEKAEQLLSWMMGRLDYPSAETLISLSIYVSIGLAVLMYDAGRMNALALGEEGAESIGVNAEAAKKRILFSASLVVGAVVSVTGPIGFVGLIVPHAVRLVLGPDHRLLLPASALAGAAFLALSDLAARLLFNVFYTDSPVGIITAVLGGPMFLYLLRRGMKQGVI